MNCIINCLILQFIHFIGTWRLYKKAGRKFWEAIFPIYSIWVILKIIHRPTWWIILFFIPVISVIMYGIIWVEFIYFFYKQTKKEKFIVLITFGFYILYLNYSPNLKFRTINNSYFKNKNINIFESIILATCLHIYLIQPFIIPSSSMERTLLKGDFIFVSKIHYGLRLPITPIGVPIIQNTIPLLGIQSYLKNIHLSYDRLPVLTKLKRGEIIVFNFPYDFKESFLDKKVFYIKRCIALPGDRLEIKEGKLHINGNDIKEKSIIKKQYSYIIKTKEIPLNKEFIKNNWRFNEILFLKSEKKNNNKIYLYHIFITDKYAKVLNTFKTINLRRYFFTKKDYNIFPNKNKWNLDNYGPIYVPKKGDIIPLSYKNLYKYKDIIIYYEYNSFSIHGFHFFINGKKTKKYNINNNYYFMLGDNRHNSLDSRYWGFLPENYIVGKPIFILFSFDWNRDDPFFFFKWKLRCNRSITYFD